MISAKDESSTDPVKAKNQPDSRFRKMLQFSCFCLWNENEVIALRVQRNANVSTLHELAKQ